MPGTAEFKSFTFTYDNTNAKYVYSYTFTPIVTGSLTITALMNTNTTASKFYNVEDPIVDIVDTIDIEKLAIPQFFTQGFAIAAQLSADTTPETKSSIIERVFQLANDPENIYLGSNTKLVNIIVNSANPKSIILPSTSYLHYTQFVFKYLTNANFSICPYMKNTTYPITTSQLVSNAASNVFDSKLFDVYANTTLDSNFSRFSFTIANTLTNWQTTNRYPYDGVTYLTISDTDSPGSYFTDTSNSQCLYLNYGPTATSTAVLLSATSYSYPRYIIFKNTSGSGPVEFRIYGQQDSRIDSYVPTINNYPYISINLNNNEQRTIGFVYGQTNNTYYVLSDYDTTGFTSAGYPGSPVTLSNSVGIVTDENKDIKFIESIQQPGFARFNTIIFKEGTPVTTRTINVATPYNNISSVILTPSADVNCIRLQNNGSNFSYTFMTFYQNPARISVTVPVYRA